MNTDLKQNGICLTSSSVLTGGLTETERKVSFAAAPSLEEMLDRIGPLPKKSLFFGQAEDALPVLLDLSNPRPGSILVTGDRGAGKTRLLQVIARFAISTHLSQEIQYGVITSRPREWKDLANTPHCVGIFPMEAKSTVEFLHALALWTCMEKTQRQYVLLMIDGLDALTGLNPSICQEIHTLLAQGPANQTWPIATINPSRAGFAGDWLQHFHTRVFGSTGSGHAWEDAGDGPAELESLSKGMEFSVKKSPGWIKFRIPGS